jgi:hypothetical protein
VENAIQYPTAATTVRTIAVEQGSGLRFSFDGESSEMIGRNKKLCFVEGKDFSATERLAYVPRSWPSAMTMPNTGNIYDLVCIIDPIANQIRLYGH